MPRTCSVSFLEQAVPPTLVGFRSVRSCRHKRRDTKYRVQDFRLRVNVWCIGAQGLRSRAWGLGTQAPNSKYRESSKQEQLPMLRESLCSV